MEQLVFFDLETSGFGVNAEVLQIATKSGVFEFNVYIMPTKTIPSQASEINKLSVRNGKLYYNYTKKLDTVSRNRALAQLLDHLRGFNRPCVLVAHNCRFDYRHLMRIIREENLESTFNEVIAGFTDTLPLLRQRFPEKRSKGERKLSTLAAELSLPTEDAHDARHDVYLLEKVAFHHFTAEHLVENQKSFIAVLRDHIKSENKASIKKTLAPLRFCIRDNMINRIAAAGISYRMLTEVYEHQGKEEAVKLLERRVNGKSQLIKTPKILNDILDYLDQATL